MVALRRTCEQGTNLWGEFGGSKASTDGRSSTTRRQANLNRTAHPLSGVWQVAGAEGSQATTPSLLP